MDYPFLYDSANLGSARAQDKYFLLLRSEYGLLVLAAILSMDWGSEKLVYAGYSVCVFFAMVVLLYRTTQKPERDWYKCRALAESVKTITWRYCMRAEPFDDGAGTYARINFRDQLKSLLSANSYIGEAASQAQAKDQITGYMEKIRSLSFPERMTYYESNRIQNQLAWYTGKSAENSKKSVRWVKLLLFVYATALVLSILRIVFSEWKLWPTEPLLVISSSLVGWIQIKKFNELSSAYALTAHEISIMRSEIAEIKEDEQFVQFVNRSELAFSREHTQWMARQTLAS